MSLKQTSRAMLFLALLWTALATPACKAPVGVRQVGFEQAYLALHGNVLSSGEPSRSSHALLEYFGLGKLHDENPAQALELLKEATLREGIRAPHAALAELHYHLAMKTRDRGHFLAASVHAYIYLFGEFVDPPNPFATHYRLACDLYNRSLAQALSTRDGEVQIESVESDTPLGHMKIDCERTGFPWGPEAFSTFLPADAYDTRGLRERVRTQGLGVPLIAVQSQSGTKAMEALHMARKVRLPATAFLRVHGGLAALQAGEIHATLELYLTSDVARVDVDGQLVPLESDVTTPLAYTLESSEIWDFDISGFLSGRLTDVKTGVFALQPYQPGKIPLVLVHGTASSPATWAQTVNGLLLDPRIAARYQVWLALYNTGNPIAYSTAMVREALQELVTELDPERRDPALSKMVVVGHSQGGIITRMLVASSGEFVWRTLSDTAFADAKLTPEHRELLQRCIFFEPLPFISRVVFIATPHGGSFRAGGWVSALARRLVSLPRDVANTAEGMLTRRDLPPQLWKTPTSVENMAPDSHFIRNLPKLPLAEGVRMNSIIAVRPHSGPPEAGDDGIVQYTSAHIEGAESEFIVPHNHSCQGTPEAIGELRRILLEHAGVERTGGVRRTEGAGVQRASGTSDS
jgi:pimeloyl-ACP methyl ester carboxylesterase